MFLYKDGTARAAHRRLPGAARPRVVPGGICPPGRGRSPHPASEQAVHASAGVGFLYAKHTSRDAKGAGSPRASLKDLKMPQISFLRTSVPAGPRVANVWGKNFNSNN